MSRAVGGAGQQGGGRQDGRRNAHTHTGRSAADGWHLSRRRLLPYPRPFRPALPHSPITDKEVFEGSSEGSGLRYGGSAMQGWRRTMEDAHLAQLEVANDPNVAIFGVFDGHGGAEVAKFCQKYMSSEIQQLEDFGKGSVEESLERAFHRMVRGVGRARRRRGREEGCCGGLPPCGRHRHDHHQQQLGRVDSACPRPTGTRGAASSHVA